jgi:predicted nucleotidyltransferase
MSKAESNAMTIARQVAVFLKKEYGATRVMLFGSLADGFFKSHSDIDIYFEGIPSNRILRAAADCTETFRKYRLDLTPATFCDTDLRQHILKVGVVL